VRTPPYRIETERLVVRCWEPRDAPLLKDAVESGLTHLRAWMIWAPDGPEPLDDVVERLRGFRADFDRDENWILGVFEPDERRVLGGTGLHARQGPGGLEIGYWLRADAVGNGFATEVAGVLTRVGLEHCGADRIEIRVDPANVSSLAIPRRLGFREEATLRRRLPTREGPLRDAVVFTLFADEVEGAAAGEIGFRGYDAAGRELTQGQTRV
jgi:RimJ/RimL family protein N-acetyltransferase